MLNKLKPKSEFSRNVLTLMTGTTIAQAIPIAISPILTRIYTPEDFGMFALYMSAASILSVVATGRYELAIMLPKKDEDAVNIVALSIIISFFVSFISLIIVFFLNTQITNLLGNPEISNWLYFIPITVLLTGIYQSFNYWSNRKKQYKRLATSRVIQSGTTATSNLGMGFGGFGSSGLILGGVLGQGVATALLTRMVWREDNHRLNQIKKLKIFAMMRKHIKFPTWNLFSSFLYTIKENILIIVFSKYFEVSYIGYYFFAKKLLLVPSSILISAFSDVFFQKISKIDDYNEIFEVSYQYFKKLCFILTIPYIVFVVLLQYVVPFVFGDKWIDLYIYLTIMSIPIYFNILLGHFSKISIRTNKQEMSFYLHLVKLIIYSLLLFILVLNNILFLESLIFISIFEIIFIFIGILINKKMLNIENHKSYLLYIIFTIMILIEYIVYKKLVGV